MGASDSLKEDTPILFDELASGAQVNAILLPQPLRTTCPLLVTFMVILLQ